MMDAAVILEAYATHLGIPIHDPPFTDYPMWDGTALKRPADAQDWAHEIAHWQLAKPERRRLVNYGWGHDYQFTGYDPNDDVDRAGVPLEQQATMDSLPWPSEGDYPDPQEEIYACLLGFSLLVRLGEEAPYHDYGFTEHADSDTQEPAWKLTDNVYKDRRFVQPYVEQFKAWWS